MSAGILEPASAQKKVAATAATTTRRNRVAGKPAVLNDIRETMLPNGLTVLTKEVHAAPVAYFSVWYKVGSVNEEVGQTVAAALEQMAQSHSATTPGARRSLPGAH